MTEKQDYIILKLNEIACSASDLMKVAVTGEDGNLYEMSYHIKCYVNKIIKHLQKEWKNNIKFIERKNKRNEEKIKERNKQEDEVQQLMEKISLIFKK